MESYPEPCQSETISELSMTDSSFGSVQAAGKLSIVVQVFLL